MIIRSLYNVTRQMNVLQKKQENNSANAANVNTPGFKYQDLVQKTMEEYDIRNRAGGRDNNRVQELGTINFGTEIDAAVTNFTPGVLKETGIQTDFALDGNGFFTLSLENGETGYTRNGNFKVNVDGRLVTQEGYPVLASNGQGAVSEIYVPGNYLEVGENGFINGSDLRFLISNFNNTQNFELRGETIYVTGEASIGMGDASVRQGYLESANVDMAAEIVKMMEISREFQANQRTLTVLNDTLQKTVNEIGRN